MKDPYSISSAEKAAFVKTLAKLYKVYTTDLARLTDTDLDVVLTAEYEQGYVGQNTLRRMMRKLIEREHLKRYKMEEKRLYPQNSANIRRIDRFENPG
jgi:hypothetical protein